MNPEIQKYVDDSVRDAVKLHRHDGVLTQNVYLNQIIDNIFGQYVRKWSYNLALGETSTARNTNGTTPVAVFGQTGAPFPLRVHAVYVVSLDTTAGNIILKNGANTVCTIAKGTTAGVMTGATSYANTDYVPGSVCTIESSTAGNATVIIHLEFPDN